MKFLHLISLQLFAVFFTQKTATRSRLYAIMSASSKYSSKCFGLRKIS